MTAKLHYFQGLRGIFFVLKCQTPEEGNQVPYRWVECLAKPEKLPEPLLAGRVKFYRGEVREYMEIGGRFFKKVTVYTPGSKLN